MNSFNLREREESKILHYIDALVQIFVLLLERMQKKFLKYLLLYLTSCGIWSWFIWYIRCFFGARRLFLFFFDTSVGVFLSLSARTHMSHIGCVLEHTNRGKALIMSLKVLRFQQNKKRSFKSVNHNTFAITWSPGTGLDRNSTPHTSSKMSCCFELALQITQNQR